MQESKNLYRLDWLDLTKTRQKFFFESIRENIIVCDVVAFSNLELLTVSICRVYFSGGELDVLNHLKIYVNRVNKYNTTAFSFGVKFLCFCSFWPWSCLVFHEWSWRVQPDHLLEKAPFHTH